MCSVTIHCSTFDLPSDRHSSELLRVTAAVQGQTVPLLQVKHCDTAASVCPKDGNIYRREKEREREFTGQRPQSPPLIVKQLFDKPRP